MSSYQALADAVSADMATGRLRPGTRLPPQRAYAHERGIANSTASRVYAELVRRGLVTGEVGRGTFVVAGSLRAGPALTEPSGTRVDLELNFPVLAEQHALMMPALLEAISGRADALAAALVPVGAAGTGAARSAAARLLARGGWFPDPEGIRFAGGGKQAIAAAVAALVPAGERLGVEALTYPVVKSIAARLGVTLVPLAMDADGLRPDALDAAQRSAPLRAVYLQPALHNPLGATMPPARLAEIALALRRYDLAAVEDAVYAFLLDDPPPLAALAPERVVVVDSLSKRLAPGLTLGIMAAPTALADRVAGALRSGAWLAGGFALEVGTRWMMDGTAEAVGRAKQSDAATRQAVVREQLTGLAYSGDARAYHLWLSLPEPWRAEVFVAAGARRGIAVTPATAFAGAPGHAPGAVRLALASPPLDVLRAAATTLADLAKAGPGLAALE